MVSLSVIAEPNPLQNTVIRFAVIGDYGANNPAEEAVAKLVNNLNPDFIITTGDNSYGPTNIDENIGKYYSNYIGDYKGKYGPGSSTNRFFPSLGNHDYDDGGGIDAYEAYFTLPGKKIKGSNTSGNERYYDFIQGPVHFFVIDSDVGSEPPGGIPSISTQGIWLKNQLAASTAPWKIVYLHHPPHTSDRHGPNKKMQWPYEEWGASTVLAGHDHTYERILRDDNEDSIDFPYFVNGLGGRAKYKFYRTVPGSKYRYNDNYGAMLIEACVKSITFSFYTIPFMDVPIDKYMIGGSTCFK